MEEPIPHLDRSVEVENVNTTEIQDTVGSVLSAIEV